MAPSPTCQLAYRSQPGCTAFEPAHPDFSLAHITKQEVLHLHRFDDDWPALKLAATGFLDEFATGSKELLRYVGLSDPVKLYRSLFPEEAAMPGLRY